MTQTKTKPTLLLLIDSLSPDERTRLEDLLLPVVNARKAYMEFVLITMPSDIQEIKEIHDKRAPFLIVPKKESVNNKDARLSAIAKLDLPLAKARAKVNGVPVEGWLRSGHTYECEQLKKAITKTKDTFSRHY